MDTTKSVYSCSAEELRTFEEIGPATAKKVVQLRDAVLRGEHLPIEMKDLVNINPKVRWNDLIYEGWISIIFDASTQPKDIVTAPGPGVVSPTPLTGDIGMRALYELIEQGNVNLGRKIETLRQEFSSSKEETKAKFHKVYSYIDESTTNAMSVCSNTNTHVQTQIQECLASNMDRYSDLQRAVSRVEFKCKDSEETAAEAIKLASIALEKVDSLQQSPADNRAESIPLSVEIEEKLNLTKPSHEMSQFLQRMESVTPSIYKRAESHSKSLKKESSLVTPPTVGNNDDVTRSIQQEPDRASSRPPIKSDMSKSSTRDRSRSPAPPRMELFSGDPKKMTWSSFITRFGMVADRRDWDGDKRLDRLFNCLTGTALEFANSSKSADCYNRLIEELELRFDNRDAPIAARQLLHVVQQQSGESLEEYLQRVLVLMRDGYVGCDTEITTSIATEAFLRGCSDKDGALQVMQERPTSIQDACRRLKAVVANRKAIRGGKEVSFKERLFTAQEEDRVATIEKKLETLTLSAGGSEGPQAYQYRGRSSLGVGMAMPTTPKGQIMGRPIITEDPRLILAGTKVRSPGRPQRSSGKIVTMEVSGGLQVMIEVSQGGQGYGRPPSNNPWDNYDMVQ